MFVSKAIKSQAAILGIPWLTVAFMAGPGSTAVVGEPDRQPAAAGRAVEEVVVTGIRNSLRQALDVKRNSIAVVDAITAEDIGKFPDQNVAESLQRITGVSIDRDGGEGRFVTVRGLGPQFNNTLLNGRTIATDTYGRQFGFDLLASEVVSRAEVYKTSTAAMPEGGIGSTINIRTARPFDFNGFKAAVSGNAVMDTNADGATPAFSGLVSNTFAEGNAGVLLSVVHQERKGRVNGINVPDGYYALDPCEWNLVNAGLCGEVDGQGVYVPQNINQIVDNRDLKRTGGTAVFQFRPGDRLLLTVDGLYSDLSIDSRTSELGHWFWRVDEATIDSNRTATRIAQHGIDTEYISDSYDRPTKVKAAGFNAEFDATNNLSLSADISWSEASRRRGDTHFAVIGGVGGNSVWYDNTSNVPTVGAAPGGVSLDTQDTSGAFAHVTYLEGADTSDEVFEFRLDGEWRNEADTQSLKFGAYAYDRTKKNTPKANDNPDTPRRGGEIYGWSGTPIASGNLLSPFDGGSFFSDLGHPARWLSFDFEEYLSYLETPEAINAHTRPDWNPTPELRLMANGGLLTIFEQPARTKVEERVMGGYVSLDFSGEFLDKPYRANAGVRYVRTKSTSTGLRQNLLDLEPKIAPNGTITDYEAIRGDLTSVDEGRTYDDFLPSVNVALDVTEDLVARIAYAKTLTRPTLDALAPRLDHTVNRPGALQAEGGNPLLRPFKADNVDLSLEWYYSDASALSGAAFYKKVDNFIVQIASEEDFALPSGTYTYNVRRPRNGEKATIRGLEFSWQHNFDSLPAPFDGLGFMANVTFVDSNAVVDLADTSQIFAMEGLGDSQNLVVFYEKGRIQARAALNNRENFLQDFSNNRGEPVFVEDYIQLDLSGSYQITDNLMAFVEAINVTNERTRKHGRYRNHFLALQDTGARYTLGVRASF